MRTVRRITPSSEDVSDAVRQFLARRAVELIGLGLIALAGAIAISLITWSVNDPSLTHAKSGRISNWLGAPGAIVADLSMQIFGLATIAWLTPVALWGWRLLSRRRLPRLPLT